jgi:hypothetical protein
MRPSALVATATIVVLAFGASACKSSSKSGAPAAASNPPATETQADSDNPNLSASPSASTSASASPAASVAASTSASTPASASPSTASTAPAAAAGAALNACSLLTGAQASSLTGRDFGPGTASTIAPGQDQCDYPYTGTDFGVDLIVIVYEPTSGVGWSTMQAVLSGVGPVTQVPGVGDKAMFAGLELDVATGKWLVAVQGADKLNQDAGAIAIGKVLVGALASKGTPAG